MKVAVFALVALVAVVCAFPEKLNLPQPGAGGQNWALLVAGSNTWMNYRHQADVCHAYQVLHSHGIPESNIVVMMYDDIANNAENPAKFKGKVYNNPAKAVDVYAGVPKDCTGNDVTAANFLAVLSGDKKAVKGCNGAAKIINSGPNDNVFVFFSDHGAPGLVAMPVGPYLYAKDLVATLKSMAAANKFKQLVFYLEACESGSMFDPLLPNNINIFATTASNAQESSYACYYDSEVGAYLGDLYSVNWMENSDKAVFSSETLQQQFVIVKNETNLSHVMEYGQMSISSEVLQNFQGHSSSAPSLMAELAKPRPLELTPQFTTISSRDVTVETLYRKWKSAVGPAAKQAAKSALETEITSRDAETKKMQSIVDFVNAISPVSDSVFTARHAVDHDCLRTMVENVEFECGRFTDFSLGLVYVLNNMCHDNVSPSTVGVAAARVCH